MPEVAIPPMTEAEARELIESIRRDLGGLAEKIRRGWEGQAWLALGYESWAQLCDAEFGGLPQLPAGERVAVVRELSRAGMSGRAIGDAIGVSRRTVDRDRDRDQVGQDVPPDNVIGLDGKRYCPAPKRPPKTQADSLIQNPERIAELAKRGLTGAQIADRLGASPEYVRKLARGYGIKIPADAPTRTNRAINHTRLVDETVTAIESLAVGLGYLDLSRVDMTAAPRWIKALDDALPKLSKLRKQIKDGAGDE